MQDTPSFTYNGLSLAEAIDASMAYDEGFVDSGIRDEDMKEAVRVYLKGLSKDDRRRTLAVLARDRLSDEMIEQGYGLADVAELHEWLIDLGVERL